ncbi:MAG: hypothetical protein A2Y78_00055 [Acidobacteria bacterium RBG_13_68_16]|nr:MAG: hypothetical protein A2Y78_00055 [Acidobacteria bacterium RBG_13_68_16]
MSFPPFGQPPAPAAPPGFGGPTPPPTGRSKYAGIVAAEPREPQPAPGTYQLEVLALHEGVSPKSRLEWWKAICRVVAVAPGSGQADGDEVAVLQMMTPSGAGLVKQFLLAAFGTDEAQFNAWAASVGDAAVNQALVGRRVNADVSRGSDIPDKPGEFYRNYRFQAV